MTELTEFEAADTPKLPDALPAPVLWAERLLTLIAGAILFVTMVMTTIDVIGRYVFNSPLGFAYEVTKLLMATVVFVALPPVTLHREHITIGLFNGLWTGRLGAGRDLVVALLVALGTGFLCYRMFLFVGRFYSYSDRTDTLRIPLYPVAAIGAVGIGLAALAALTLAFYAARRLVRGTP